jgi:phenylalanyl-tRNA synthetase beta chain
MLASYKWLRELCAFSETPEQVAQLLTRAGLEVEREKRCGELPGVVVAEVRARGPHPKSDKLSLVTLFDGSAELAVVCGAPNVPEPGKRVLFARLGAKLPNGMEIGARKVAGVDSQGMICSELELDIGVESDGIVVLPDALDAAPGCPVSQALDLEDVVFEIGVTPNRPDCLGHIGLARELSALTGVPLVLPTLAPTRVAEVSAAPAGMHALPLAGPAATSPSASLREGPAIEPVPVRVEAPDRCPRYAAAVVEDVRIEASPFWLRYRLHRLGLRAINNAVDITNLVLLEWGYPTHAFDLDLVRGRAIEVRLARPGERIEALDGVERALDTDDLAICDAEGPVAIAGVMGGQRTSIHAATRRVLIETAYFDPRGVRRSARRLGLHTDSSHRFERGVDPRAVPQVIARVAALLGQLAGGRVASVGHELKSAELAPRQIGLRRARIATLLGVIPPPGKVEQVLRALGCEVERLSDGSLREPAEANLRVLAPTFRPDLTREEDLIEEVARIWGYDQIPSIVPAVQVSQGTATEIRFLRALRTQAASAGLTEVVNYAFVSPSQLERARVPTDALRLANPLSEERSVMRTSLLPGLLANLQRAQRHQVPSCAIFELARSFRPSAELLPEERYKLGIVLAGARGGFIGDGEPLDFYDGKGVLDGIVRPLTRGVIETAADANLAAEHPALHPRRAARVVLFGQPVGVLGELHPDVLDGLELTGPVVYAELDVATLVQLGRGHLPPQVRPLPRFPASSRDLAIAVDEEVEAGTVAAALRATGGTLVEEIQLFDLYRGGQLGQGKKSLAFRIRYRDPEATLTDQRVEEVHGRVVADAERRFGARIRA